MKLKNLIKYVRKQIRYAKENNTKKESSISNFGLTRSGPGEDFSFK